MSTENKEKIGPGKFVAYSYKVYNNEDHSLLFEATPEAPDTMVFGVSRDVIPGLIAAIDGLSAGDKFSVTLPPEAAFGNREDGNVLELEKEIFMRDGKLAEEVKEGAMLPMMTAEGYRVMGKVTEIGDKIKMDFNHPFAGITVEYEGEIIDVREATPEEIQGGSGCGGCCSGGNCGEGCGEGCGNCN